MGGGCHSAFEPTEAPMEVSREDLERRYAEVSDQELLDRYSSGTLTELAKSVVREESRRRGLSVALATDEPAALEPPVPQARGPLVPVATQLTYTEANILCSLLNSEGIACELAHAYLSTAHHFLSASTGGVRLLVAESDLPRVREVIAALKRGEYALDHEAASSHEP
jgi:hypothetical protein